MKHPLLTPFFLLFATGCALAAEFHVSPAGNDTGPGDSPRPFRTIQRAAEAAQPGDTITVHAGIYRERVDPPRGGLADDRRITYQAAPGEVVEIRGSEVVTGWTQTEGDVWQVAVPASRFGTFNPFADVLKGDWFRPQGRVHHTGAVYCDGRWLGEVDSLDVLKKDAKEGWWAEAGPQETVIYARFPGLDPNRRLTEINVRQSVFYPSQPGRDWITVRGFRLRHAATPWAPPTAEQIGLLGTHWSRGWIIENNTVTHSMCTGITLGKYGDAYDNAAGTAEGYVGTIKRALAHPIPWTRERIGGHVVRRNTVAYCEQAGIVGSLGAIFSTISDNVVHDIHVRRRFSGAEQAALKFHAALDTVISGNHIYRSHRGIWLDWMTQGTQVTGNIIHDNLEMDIFLEVNHGPFLVANNLLLSPLSLVDWSQGGAFVHNIFAGVLAQRSEHRRTPWHAAHGTEIAGMASISGGDNRFFNNVFVGTKAPTPTSSPDIPYTGRQFPGLTGYDELATPILAEGNVYFGTARPGRQETGARVSNGPLPTFRVDTKTNRLLLQLPQDCLGLGTRLVHSELLGRTRVSGLPFVLPDGSPLRIDRDIRGLARSSDHPVPGPLESTGPGEIPIDLPIQSRK
jgi:alpha-N-arabinofuranosidase